MIHNTINCQWLKLQLVTYSWTRPRCSCDLNLVNKRAVTHDVSGLTGLTNAWRKSGKLDEGCCVCPLRMSTKFCIEFDRYSNITDYLSRNWSGNYIQPIDTFHPSLLNWPAVADNPPYGIPSRKPSQRMKTCLDLACENWCKMVIRALSGASEARVGSQSLWDQLAYHTGQPWFGSMHWDNQG